MKGNQTEINSFVSYFLNESESNLELLVHLIFLTENQTGTRKSKLTLLFPERTQFEQNITFLKEYQTRTRKSRSM